jgi:hypothetical protein
MVVAPPFLARAAGTPLGAFSMFARLERYHLELTIQTPSGEEPLKLNRLAPHLSRDARRVILPAAGYAVGGDQVDLLEGGLEDIARLVCQLRPRARAVRARLYRGGFDQRALRFTQIAERCQNTR